MAYAFVLDAYAIRRIVSFTMSETKRKSIKVPKEVWLVWVDHSALGVWLSKEKAERAVRLRRRDSLLEVDYRIQGYTRMVPP